MFLALSAIDIAFLGKYRVKIDTIRNRKGKKRGGGEQKSLTTTNPLISLVYTTGRQDGK
jgi:hypothetical protein